MKIPLIRKIPPIRNSGKRKNPGKNAPRPSPTTWTTCTSWPLSCATWTCSIPWAMPFRSPARYEATPMPTPARITTTSAMAPIPRRISDLLVSRLTSTLAPRCEPFVKERGRFAPTRAAARAGAVRGVLHHLEVDLLHLQHRLHRALAALRVGVAQELPHPLGDDLPAQAEPVLEPSAHR